MKTEILNTAALDESSLNENLLRAAKVIREGNLVVFPTETVYGLGADATNPSAASKIYEAKGRPSDNPLIIHISKPEDAEKYTYTSKLYYDLAKAFMPGPLTVVLPVKDSIPEQTRASLPTVAVRCPSHPIARKLIELSEVPIAAPSANLSGSPSATNVSHVIDDMTGRVDMIIDGGDSDFGLESTIVKIENDEEVTLLRPGKITVEDLLSVCPVVNIANAVKESLKEGEKVLSPGMKYRHYAPKAPLYLFDADINELVRYINAKKAKNIAVVCYDEDFDTIRRSIPNAYIYRFGEKNDKIKQAHLLFGILRDADKKSFDAIYAPLPEEDGVGLALYNRMIRAAAYHIIRM